MNDLQYTATLVPLAVQAKCWLYGRKDEIEVGKGGDTDTYVRFLTYIYIYIYITALSSKI